MENRKMLFTSVLANFSKFNRPLMRWFREHGWEVHYASQNEEEVLDCDNSFSICFHRSPYHVDNIKAYFQLKRLIDAEQYDLIHCHTPMGGVITRLAAMGVRRRGTQVLYTAHGFHFYKGAPFINWLLYFSMEKILSFATDCLITMNQEDFDSAHRYRFGAKKIEKIDGVGVDLKRFRPVLQEEKKLLRQQYGFSPDSFIVIYPAEFIVRKNHILLFQLLPELIRQIPNLVVVLAGTGELFDASKQSIEKLQLADRVHFLGYRKDMPQLYQLSDLLISTSKQEGLPMCIIEGMACGLPVVCSRIRGQTDLIQQGENGILCEFEKASYLAAIDTLFESTELREQMGRKSWEASAKYDLQHAVQTMAQIYNIFKR